MRVWLERVNTIAYACFTVSPVPEYVPLLYLTSTILILHACTTAQSAVAVHACARATFLARVTQHTHREREEDINF